MALGEVVVEATVVCGLLGGAAAIVAGASVAPTVGEADVATAGLLADTRIVFAVVCGAGAVPVGAWAAVGCVAGVVASGGAPVDEADASTEELADLFAVGGPPTSGTTEGGFAPGVEARSLPADAKTGVDGASAPRIDGGILPAGVGAIGVTAAMSVPLVGGTPVEPALVCGSSPTAVGAAGDLERLVDSVDVLGSSTGAPPPCVAAASTAAPADSFAAVVETSRNERSLFSCEITGTEPMANATIAATVRIHGGGVLRRRRMLGGRPASSIGAS